MSHESLKNNLLRKLYQGTCTRDELIQLFDLLSDPSVDSPPAVMQELLQNLEQTVPDDPERIARIQARIAQKKNYSVSSDKAQKRSRWGKKIKEWQIAATILTLFAAATWLLGSNFLSSNDIYNTDFGEIIEVELPDGSQVSLNGNSRLELQGSWKEGEDRRVLLHGEAYFKVKKKPATNAKFSVVTADVTVNVLGTSFNVNTHQSETRVFLEEGDVSIELEDSPQLIALKPGQVLRYSAVEKKLIPPEEIEEDLEVSWKAGIMEFRNTPLNNILLRIADAHHLDFTIADDELKNREFTLALPTGDMDVTMQILSKTTGTLINKENGEYVLRIKPEKEKEED